MPLSMTMVMYGLSILVGVLFVVFGLRIKPLKREPSSDMHESWCPFELAAPTHDSVPLQFPDDVLDMEESVPVGPRRYSSDPAAPRNAGIRFFSAALALFLGILKAPFRIFSRKRSPEDVEGVEKPMAAGTVLSTVVSKKTPESISEEE